jgi:DNA-binding transcriptional LysR family regulator
MQIEALKLFCDIIRFRSFSDSAQANGVTQPAASQTVQALEERLGVPLIDRSRRPWKLTSEGELFYHGCRDVLRRYESLEAQVKGLPLAREAQVRVAAIYSVGLRHMKRYAQEYEAQYKPARVHLSYLSPDKVYEAVLSGDADLGIVSFPKTRQDLVVLPWREEPFVVAASPDHWLAKARSADLKSLTGEKFVAFDRGLDIRAEVDRFLKKRGVAVDVVFEFDNIEAIKQAVEIGSGLSLLPRPTLDREVQAGTLAAIPLRGVGFVRPLAILRRSGAPEGAAVARFIELLRKPDTVLSAA